MAREVLRWTQESTWGTYNAAGTTAIIQLDQSNQFTVRRNPVRWTIRSAGSYNRRVQTGTAKYSVGGALNMLVYDTQLATLGPALFATTGNTLGSFTLDHFLVMEDGSNTKVFRRYTGCMCSDVTIAAKEADQLMRLNLSIIAKDTATITITDLPEPAAGDYPSSNPYVFEHAGAFTLGTARSEFEDITISIKNILDARFFRTAAISRIKYCGRDVNVSIRFPYILTTDRSNLEAQTAASASVTFTNGSSSLACQFNTKNYTASVTDDLSLDKIYMQAIELENYFDPAAGTPTDATFTVV